MKRVDRVQFQNNIMANVMKTAHEQEKIARIMA